MPISQTAFVRATLLIILVGLVALAAIVASTLWLVGQTRTNSSIVTLASQQRTELVNLRDLLLNAETGQRGYLLTDNESYLAPYDEARSKIAPQLELVSSLLKDRAQKSAFARLSEIVTNKMSELGQTIELSQQQGRRDEALAIVNSDRGRNLMTEAHNILGRLIDRADRDIADAVRQQQDGIAALRIVTFVGAVVIFAVVGGAVLIVLRYTRQLAEAQREVQELNAGLEERVLERTVDLGRANDEIQRFAYIVTHDLRAPLVNIMGFTSELEASLAPIQAAFKETEAAPPEAELTDARVAALEDLPEAISFIRSSTRKMDGLINAILKLSREGRRTLKPELVQLDSLLENVVANVQHQLIDAGGHVSIDGKVPPIVSDRLALDQIFGNLLDNAIKYRDTQRPLSIQIHIGNELGRRIFIAVEDNGRGIAKQDHERVFDLFRRSGAQDQPGEGIGLAHVRAMSRSLGGDIMVTSELGRGTTFRVSLPKDLRKVIGAG